MATFPLAFSAFQSVLSVGSKGASVTLLHSSLLQLHLASRDDRPFQSIIPPSELATATFGPFTRLAVLSFQQKNASLFANPPSGVVDIETATIILSQLMLHGIDPSSPRDLFVAGSVHFADGSTSSELSVEVYDKDFNEEKLLSGVIVGQDGYFVTAYTRSQCIRAESGRSPTLLIRVVFRKRPVYEPTVDQLFYDAQALVLIEIPLAERAPTAPTTDDFSQIITALNLALPPIQSPPDNELPRTDATSLLTPLPLDPNIGKRISLLREDEKVQNLSYLARLKAIDIPKPNLINVILAHRLADVAQKENQMDLPAELFYAVLATNTHRELTSRNPANIGVADLDLETPTQPLLYQLALLDYATISSAIKEGLLKNLVSDKLTAIDFSPIWNKLGDIGRHWFELEPTQEDLIWDMIKDFLETGKESAVREVLGGEKVEGDLLGFINDISAAFMGRKKVALQSPPPIFPMEENLRPAASQQTFDVAKTIEKLVVNHTPKDLANTEPPVLEKLVASALGQTDKDETAAKIKDATLKVSTELETLHPTASFRAKLRHHINTTPANTFSMEQTLARDASSRDSSDANDVKQPPNLGHDSLAIDAQAVSSFLDSNDDFDLLHSKLELFHSPPEPNSTSSDSIAKVQRIFKIAPTFEKTQALLDLGFHSASSIARLGQPQLLNALTKSPSFSTSDATEVFNRAANIRLAAALLAGDLQGASNSLLPAGLSAPVPPAKLEALTKNFPNIASLFQISDTCACDDCRTVYSPSAYFVDVLEFLKDRGVLDSAGQNTGLSARAALLKRRPDLADLDLSCGNTNTTLPYIDLVCELLEDFVAPDGLAAGSFTGTAEKGKISDDLLTLLRDELKLPITPSALVSGTYKGGYRTVRDEGIAISLEPSQQKVQVLRNTFGDSATLAASPAYVNTVAYDRLYQSTYFPSLPFSLAHEECRGYLKQLGVSRATLMETLVPGEVYHNAIEELGLTSADGKMITISDNDGQEKYWNTGNPSSPTSVLKNVLTFITTARIEYEELQALMDATAWVNPPSNTPVNPAEKIVGAMFIKHLDDTCSLDKKEISGLDNAALDRFHRFLRLWKTLMLSTDKSWTIDLLDRFIGATKLGAKDLGTKRIESLLAVISVRSLLGDRLPTTVGDIVDVYAGLSLKKSLDTKNSLPPTTYSTVFLNSTSNGAIDDAFAIRHILLNDSITPPSPVPTLSEHSEYISNCLGITTSEMSLITGIIEKSQQNEILSLSSLSDAYSIIFICRRLGLSVSSYITFTRLSNLNPLVEVSQLSQFATMTKKMQSIGMSASDIAFLIEKPTVPPAPEDIREDVIIQLLTSIQEKYASIKAANQSPFDTHLTPAENADLILVLLAQIQGIGQIELSQFRRMFEGGMSAADGSALITAKLKDSIGDAATARIDQAQIALAADPISEAKKISLIKVILDTISTYIATLQRRTALEEILNYFDLSSDITSALLTGVPLLEVLLDESLSQGVIAKDVFPLQFKALHLAQKLAFVLPKFGLSASDLSWLLSSALLLGWADIATLPTDTADEPVSWMGWIALVDYVEKVKANSFPSVKSVASNNMTISLTGLLDLVLKAETSLPSASSYFATLAGDDPDVISELSVHFGFTTTSFRQLSVLEQLDDAAQVLRKSGLPTAIAIPLAKAETLSVDDTAKVRGVLKSRYPILSDWYDVLKIIQDPLRLRKRDSLVDFLLASNKPGISSATEISELLLLDVEMGTETLTSRIIQAHQSVQQFVQRLLMGLEPTPIVGDDPKWDHWPEMSLYRLWEANKKIFLYPENWIDPDLRDNKSELYVTLEELLRAKQITQTHVESVTANYLKGLDHIADLTVMAGYYEVPTSTFHVFARTKGGSPNEYFHRKLLFETEWSPWELLVGVDISGEHLLSFNRNNRLTIVWPIFSYEPDPKTQNTPPAIPSPTALPEAAPSRMQRLKIQLALSERDPDTGNWSPKVLTNDGVFWPGPGENYLESQAFPAFLEANISLHYWELGGNLGETIVVCFNDDTTDTGVSLPFGMFSIDGSKGYPKPYHFADSSGTGRRGMLIFQSYPKFRQTTLAVQKFAKSRLLPTRSNADLAIQTILDGGKFVQALGKEYGRFEVAYPLQPTIIDRTFVGLQMYTLGRSSARPEFGALYRSLLIPQGTFLPYFVIDSSARGYAFTPGFEGSVEGDSGFRTASKTFEFFNKALKLALKYIDLYYNAAGRDITKLRDMVNSDDDYIALKKEFLTVYLNADNPKDIKIRSARANVTSFYHPLTFLLRSKLFSDGISGLLARKTQLGTTNFDFKNAYAPTDYVRTPFPREDLDFSLAGPYSSYNWELFFHLPFQIAAKFSRDQQFELARNWYHFIFNPQGMDMEDPDTGPGRAAAPQKKYWQTNPFFRRPAHEYLEQRIDSILSDVASHPDGFSLADSLKLQVQLWRAKPFSPHVIARTRTVAYQLCIVVKYIQNLVDWGDQLFRQLTRESITQASTLYMIANKLLGAKPRSVAPAVEVPTRTYNELGKDIDIVGNALLSLENLIPDLGSLPHGGQELPTSPPLTSLYFGIPPNTQMLELWDLVADRLFKIRHSQDIDGTFVSLALTSPPIDPGAIVKALAAGASLQDIMNGLNAPLPHYRYSYMIERAHNLAQQVIALGSELLSVLEKRDEEGLARLRASSENSILTSMRTVKTAAVSHNTALEKALTDSKAMAVERQTYYQGLVKVGLLSDEQYALDKHDEALIHDWIMMVGHALGGGASLVPTISTGVSGFGGTPQVSVSWGGGNIAGAISSFMNAVSTDRNRIETKAMIGTTLAGYSRRKDEWDFQAKLATKEMAYIDSQVKAAKAAGTMLSNDLKTHDASARESKTAERYLKSKFTNTELFDWAVSKTAAMYFQLFQLAYSMAKKAERCMGFELGDFSSASFIKNGYWDNLHNGLLAGQALQLDINRLELAYTDRHARELELIKSVSLARLDPTALLALRTTGKCIFALPEWIFDLDHPGQYCRRTKSINISIPCVVGPFTSVSATLRLLSSRYRSKTTRLDAYAEDPSGDDRFVYNVVPPPVMTVASSAVNDSGVHEMRLDDPRYLPFEHAGVLGTYSLELPRAQQFPYTSIADAIFTVSYTARDGGSSLRTAAAPVPVNGTAAVAIRTAFPSEWNALKAGRAAEPIVVGNKQLPHWATAQGRSVVVGESVWCAIPTSGLQLESLTIKIAGETINFVKLGEGLAGFWKGTVPARKVIFGEKVVIEWANAEDAKKVEELVCVVAFDVQEPRA